MTEEELWLEDDSEGYGIFLLMKSAEIRAAGPDDPYTDGKLLRCDYGRVGPVGLLWEPDDGTLLGQTQWGIKSPDIVDGTLKEFTQLITYPSHFYLVYSSRATKNEDGTWGSFLPHMNCYPGTKVLLSPVSARTLGGVLRSIWEWSTIADEPFNDTSFVPLLAKKFMETVPFTDEVLDEIRSFPDQDLYRYLKGEEDINLHERPAGPYPLSDGFKSWFTSMRETYHPTNTEWLSEL